MVAVTMAGYHEANIPKGVFGERSKIEEELAELIDAERQGVRIMAMCELADLYGALVEYAERKYGLSEEDLGHMAHITARAFQEGQRK
jgi:ribosome-binding protein aMBF1 (putative translation factor)